MKNLRNSHLLEAALQIAASGKSLPLIQIARHIVNRPAPEYYVSYDRAIRYLPAYQRNKLRNRLSRNRRMWMEIFGRVDDTLRRNPRINRRDALQRVLCRGKASSFFIKPTTAARILRRHKSLLNNNTNTSIQ